MNLPNFEQAKVLIVGDIMLDRYCIGDTGRISPEAPVPVVHVKETVLRPGGAGNVALNVRALGAAVKLISVVGKDPAAKTLTRELEAVEVGCHFIEADHYLTIVKQRILSRHQQLLRLDYEYPCPENVAQEITEAFEAELEWANVVILSDYAKGVLKGDCRSLIKRARQKGIPVLVDPKKENFQHYQGASLITPNFKEFQEVVGKCESEAEILERARALVKEDQLDALLVTRGEHGMTLVSKEDPELYLPARGREVFDVTGAGDTVISVIASSLAAGATMALAVELGNVAAGIVIGKLGSATVTASELMHHLSGKASNSSGVMTDESLMMEIQEARANGEKIIFTNGCFDILHAMHVDYLELAKALGGRLVVAVNTDESIKRLKGPERPVNALEHRMAVLAGLQSVDWVVPFSEDTPQRLIEKIRPDVLAKGGDYKSPDELVGAEFIKAYGGQVVVLGHEERGVKTTAIIDRIKSVTKTMLNKGGNPHE